ncbi:MAG: hypothetical protein HDT14_04140 [Oscillibacter sp.]|nr:hypothetical protein [Oscillibacter sp.]
MMCKMKNAALVFVGILVGITLSGPVAQAAAGLMANPSSQKFYLDDQKISLQAYEINGSNYVKLRDIGEAVDFGVAYDAATNTVTISPDKPYEKEVPVPAATTPSTSLTSPSALNKNADGSINVPQDGSQYVPQVGDVIRCDDGTNYTITDVSRYDKNMFASGPVGPLPTATCDWSQFDQPELPRAEVRHYSLDSGEYIFIRNLYETRRMLYSLYNAMGEDEWIMQSGTPRLRADGSPWVHIHLTLPADMDSAPFWPWREEAVPNMLHSCPGGNYYLEAWDVFKDGVFQRTEYHLR